jgi:metal-dependent hydrolase (beta-lactamase superfamily II)
VDPRHGLDRRLSGVRRQAADERRPRAPPSGEVRIRILYDAFSAMPDMTRDWGYAALVEVDRKRILFDETTQAAPGIHLIALVSDAPGTRELREVSLAIETPAGLVLLVGCSHPGIERIAEAAAAIDPRILLIAGGFHLVAAPDPELERIAKVLHDRLRVAFLAPGHCTGEPAFTAFARVFADRYLYAGVGSVISLSTSQVPPRPSG